MMTSRDSKRRAWHHLGLGAVSIIVLLVLSRVLLDTPAAIIGGAGVFIALLLAVGLVDDFLRMRRGK